MLETIEPSSSGEASGLFTDEGGHARCFWCRASPLYRHYHDHEWGFPVTDERRLFEKLCLEGFQAGLSWITILNKREAFRAALAQFEAEPLADFGAAEVDQLMGNAGIVRHRGKIESAINNARRVLELRREFGS
ncbi:MAG: DNA-3-methyladenine glycosylase I, partial [Diaphorobacter nitroreducens]